MVNNVVAVEAAVVVKYRFLYSESVISALLRSRSIYADLQ